MNNFVPPFIEGRQLELLIKAIVDLWEAGVLKKYDELFEQLSAAMSSAVQRESPISQPVSFQSHEPPVSDKYNRFFITPTATWRLWARSWTFCGPGLTHVLTIPVTPLPPWKICLGAYKNTTRPHWRCALQMGLVWIRFLQIVPMYTSKIGKALAGAVLVWMTVGRCC